MSEDPRSEPRWTPGRWLNGAMSLLLRTPGIQRLVGRNTALLTFTGRMTGRSITTPVSYLRVGDRIITTAHRTRQWWRNLLIEPAVSIRLAGRDYPGTASVMDDPDDALDDFTLYLEAQPLLARVSDVSVDAEGRVSRSEALAALTHTVVVSIRPEPGLYSVGVTPGREAFSSRW